MNTIYMKITGFDETSNSLLVSFASDTTKSQDPSQYQSVAFQPFTMWPSVTDPTQIPQLIATAGMWQAQQQQIQESFVANPANIAAYQAMVGQTMSFPVSSLVTPATTGA
jgi:hypothetical protein